MIIGVFQQIDSDFLILKLCGCVKMAALFNSIKTIMIKPQAVEDVVSKIGELIPQDLKTIRDEFHTNAKAVLVAGLKKMDLVTREEFDVQKAVLAKTREKLKMLETELKNLQKS